MSKVTRKQPTEAPKAGQYWQDTDDNEVFFIIETGEGYYAASLEDGEVLDGAKEDPADLFSGFSEDRFVRVPNGEQLVIEVDTID